MIELGTFDTKVFDNVINNPEGWQSYSCGSPAEGLPFKTLKSLTSIKGILEQWYIIESIKWAKIHKMPPNGCIRLHTDPKQREGCHVIHMVISTNDKVIFWLNDEFVKMKQGRIYEIDNTFPHYVKNEGISDRVHIMVLLFGKHKREDT